MDVTSEQTDEQVGSGPDHWDWIEPELKGHRAKYVIWAIENPPGLSVRELDQRHRQFTVDQWNATVALLADGDGYDLVRRLHERLVGLRRETELEIERLDAKRWALKRAVDVLEKEAEAHGSKTLVGDPVTPLDAPSEWRWEEVESGGESASPPGLHQGVRYRLVDPRVDDALSIEPGLSELPELSVSPTRTWKSHLSAARLALVAVDRGGRDYVLDARRRMIEPRLFVVGGVLDEFEVFGAARPIGDSEALTLALKDEQKQFIEKALDALAIIEDDERRPDNATKSFNAVANQLETLTEWSKGAIETFIKNEINPLVPSGPIYVKWKGAGSGPGKGRSQKERYESFRDGIVAIARAAGMDVSRLDDPNGVVEGQ